MKILFDQGTPAPLRKHLGGHEIRTSAELEWSERKSGELLARAESEGFELFLATDQSIRYQQNLESRSIAILVLMTTSWPKIQQRLPEVGSAVDEIEAGSYCELQIETKQSRA